MTDHTPLTDAAKQHDADAVEYAHARSAYEAVVMGGDADTRRVAWERMDVAAARYTESLTVLVATRKATVPPFETILADPTVQLDPKSSILASIAAYSAAKATVDRKAMTDHTPLTDEELAVMEADAYSFATAANLCDLIADLRASRAEVDGLEDALRSSLAEGEVLRVKVGQLQAQLINNIHDVRTALHGSSSALSCSPLEAHKRTVAEVERLRAALTDAIEEMEDMIAYVPDHFREKWKHDEAIARAKRAVSSDG